jgi:hypothetical protein
MRGSRGSKNEDNEMRRTARIMKEREINKRIISIEESPC